MLPRKTIIIILAGLILLTLALFFAFVFIEKKPRPNTEVAQINSVLGKDYAKPTAGVSEDTDKDGLKDWEEMLWNTDVNKADTDGDGTSDGSEVRQGRNPTTKGPNDAIDTEVVGQNTATNKPFPPTQQSKNIDKKEPVVIPTATTTIEQPKTPIITESPEKKYGNTLGDTLTAFARNTQPKIQAAFEKILKNPSIPEGFDEIYAVALQFNSLAADLQKITAPNQSLEELHSSLIKNYFTQGQALTSISSYKNSSVPVDKYQFSNKSALDTAHTLTALSQYFKTNSITFKPGEGGYIFDF